MFEDILNAMPSPAVVICADERIKNVNGAAEMLFGSNAIGRHYIAILRQPSLLDAVDGVLKTGVPADARYLTTEARLDMTWQASIARIGDTGEVLLFLEDKTSMEEAGKQRRDFVANVSHELRTPLTALLGFIETIRGAARDDAKARERFLEIMEREASRMNRLVHDLMSLNRVETQERVRPNSCIDLSSVARSAINALDPLAKERKIGVTGLTEGSTANVIGDADQLNQVLINLLENAIKYSGEGNAVNVSIEKADSHSMILGPAVILRISDNGEGIDAVHLSRLTERFYRIDNHRSRELGGTGLGLAIVKHIVNRHRGRLRFESTLGEGTTVTVILPAFDEGSSAA